MDAFLFSWLYSAAALICAARSHYTVFFVLCCDKVKTGLETLPFGQFFPGKVLDRFLNCLEV